MEYGKNVRVSGCTVFYMSSMGTPEVKHIVGNVYWVKWSNGAKVMVSSGTAHVPKFPTDNEGGFIVVKDGGSENLAWANKDNSWCHSGSQLLAEA